MLSPCALSEVEETENRAMTCYVRLIPLFGFEASLWYQLHSRALRGGVSHSLFRQRLKTAVKPEYLDVLFQRVSFIQEQF